MQSDVLRYVGTAIRSEQCASLAGVRAVGLDIIDGNVKQSVVGSEHSNLTNNHLARLGWYLALCPTDGSYLHLGTYLTQGAVMYMCYMYYYNISVAFFTIYDV